MAAGDSGGRRRRKASSIRDAAATAASSTSAPGPRAAGKPLASRKPPATPKPAAGGKPAGTRKPAAARRPAAPRTPVAARKPAAPRTPVAARKPAAPRKSAAARKPAASRKPASARRSATTSRPASQPIERVEDAAAPSSWDPWDEPATGDAAPQNGARAAAPGRTAATPAFDPQRTLGDWLQDVIPPDAQLHFANAGREFALGVQSTVEHHRGRSRPEDDDEPEGPSRIEIE